MEARWAYAYDDEDSDAGGRILSQAEYMARVGVRTDIFEFDRQQRLHVATLVALMAAVGVGNWLQRIELPVTTPPDFVHRGSSASMRGTTEVLDVAIDRTPPRQAAPQRPETRKGRRSLRPSRSSPHKSHGARASGDPRSRVTRQGVLAWASARVPGQTLPGTDLPGLGGIAEGIDLVLRSSKQGVARRGTGGTGRRTAPGVGFRRGYGPSVGGGSIDELIGDLMEPDERIEVAIRERKPKAEVELLPTRSCRTQIGGRRRSEIMRVVNQNLASLRYAYTTYLRRYSGLGGKVTVRFAVDEFGKVVHCSILESNIGNEEFERLVVEKIRRWRFDRIDNPGDITEVVYPFVFSH